MQMNQLTYLSNKIMSPQLFCINRKGSASCSGVRRCIVINKVWNLVLLTYNFNSISRLQLIY